MSKNISKKFRQIFFLPVLCAAGLTLAGCATPSLWAESETRVDYFNIESHTASWIYIDRKPQNDTKPRLGIPYHLEVAEKKMEFPPSVAGFVIIQPEKNDQTPEYNALVTLLDGRTGIQPESVKIYVKSENRTPKARFDIEFQLPEIEIRFEKDEDICPDDVVKPPYSEFFGSSGKEIYLLPLLVEKVWQKEFGEEIDSYNMMRPVAWLDENGSIIRNRGESDYSGILLTVWSNRFGVKYVRIYENIMKFKGLKDIPIDYKGNFARISVPVRDVELVTEKYDMTHYNTLNDFLPETVFDATAIDVTYKYPLALRLIGTPFTLVLDSAVAIIAVPLTIIAVPMAGVMLMQGGMIAK